MLVELDTKQTGAQSAQVIGSFFIGCARKSAQPLRLNFMQF